MAVEDSVAQDQLKAFISRIERMEEEKAAIAADIKEIYAEAKGNGFDTKILRKIVTIRKQDANERMEQEALLELYMTALNMQTSHEVAMDRALRRGTAGHSAPLFAGRIESISEPQPTKAAGQAEPGLDPVRATSSVENEAAEISTPITQTQVAPQPARDLTVPPSPQGQVALIQPETATRGVDDLGSVQDALEMSSDGQPAEGLCNSDSGTAREEKAAVTGGESAATNTAGNCYGLATKAETGKSVEPSGFAAPVSFADKIKKLRPLCQSPEACRSSGGKAHCNSCLKMAGDGLVSA
ncbi:MAG: DUF2312 domain-containing protein [Devosia sp.]|nr:DUF2312 domain-containing protein [Devosia sp.]